MVNIKIINLGGILTIVLIVLMTILSELFKPFGDFLVTILTHHWVGKGIIALAFFLLFILLFSKSKLKGKDDYWTNLTAIFAILGVVAILLFYILEFFVF